MELTVGGQRMQWLDEQDPFTGKAVFNESNDFVTVMHLNDPSRVSPHSM